VRLVLAVIGLGILGTAGFLYLASHGHPAGAVISNGVMWFAFVLWANTFGIRHILR